MQLNPLPNRTEKGNFVSYERRSRATSTLGFRCVLHPAPFLAAFKINGGVPNSWPHHVLAAGPIETRRRARGFYFSCSERARNQSSAASSGRNGARYRERRRKSGLLLRGC